jgi:hypothetical protein
VWLVLVGLLGSVTSSDSGHSTQLDSHSNSSVEVAAGPNQGGCSPPSQHRRHSIIQGKEASPAISSKSVGRVCACALDVLFPVNCVVIVMWEVLLLQKSIGVALLIVKLMLFSLVLKCNVNTNFFMWCRYMNILRIWTNAELFLCVTSSKRKMKYNKKIFFIKNVSYIIDYLWEYC